MFELRQEINELRHEVELLTRERDEARRLAQEISHMLTYACERSNHTGLRLVRKDGD